MAKVPCSNCESVYEARSMTTCPHCAQYLCPECGDQCGGVCPDCTDE